MSSNGGARRPHKQTSASTSPPLLPQQPYQSHLAFNPPAPQYFQPPQPFPTFQPSYPHPPQPQLHQHYSLSHQSPYAPSPPQAHLPPQQSMQPSPHSLAPQLPSQPPSSSPPSRKRKAPGSGAPDLASLTPTMTSSIAPELNTVPPMKSEGRPEGLEGEGAGEPPVKKSRTNTPWTAAEENRLRGLKNQQKSWGEIAKSFPNRTEGSVKKHWYKDMHHAEFAEDESQALLNAIKEYENNKWKVIGAKVGKPAKACEQYFKDHFQGKI